MSTQDLSGTTALVTGASRGFGRAIAIALSSHGAQVVGVARDRARLEELRAQLGDTFTPVAADAADPVAAGQLLDQHRPRTLVLNAGAAPLTRPIHRQTWQTFSRNWESTYSTCSTGPARRCCSPCSQTARSSRSPAEPRSTARRSAAATPEPRPPSGSSPPTPPRNRAGRARHQVHLRAAAAHPETDLGAAGVAAYAARQGVDIPAFLDRLGPALTPEQVGTAITDIATGPANDRDAYLLTATGLSPVR